MKRTIIIRAAHDPGDHFHVGPASRLSADQPGFEYRRNRQQHRSSAVEPLGNRLLIPDRTSGSPTISGTSTLYNQQGQKDTGLIVTIPGAAHNPNGTCTPGRPTGIVANGNGSTFAGGIHL